MLMQSEGLINTDHERGDFSGDDFQSRELASITLLAHRPSARPPRLSQETLTHYAAALGVHTLEVTCHLQDGLTQVCHQLRLLNILGLQGLHIVFPCR